MPTLLNKALTLARGAARGAIGSYTELRRSEGGPAPSQAAADPPKSLLADPYGGLMQMGYRDRSSAFSYDTLRSMVAKTPVVAAIIQTRTNQVASFARPQTNKFDVGYKVKMRDMAAQPSKAAKKRIEEIEQFIAQCGVSDGHQYRDGFSNYIKKVARDSLTLGHDATEIVNNRRGEPALFLAVDAATIRLAENLPEYADMRPEDIVRYVQIYEEQVVAEYKFDEMIYAGRLPATDIRLQGYGQSELEMLTDVVASILNIQSYNQNFFSNNSTPKGMINIRGDVTSESLEGFRRHWYALLSGVENSWRTPIAAAKDGIDWIPMQQSNQDMQMEAWTQYLTRQACAVFSISPEEIGFGMGPMGISSSLNTPTNTDKIIEGRERGLVPILTHFSQNINRHIINRIDEDFVFEFVGLGGMTREQQTQQAQAQVRNYRTIDEMRAEEDLPAMPDGTGAIILDPIWLQNQATLQQQAQGGQPGAMDPNGQPQPYAPDDPNAAETAADAQQGEPSQADDPSAPNEVQELDSLARGLPAARRLQIPGMTPVETINPGWFRRSPDA